MELRRTFNEDEINYDKARPGYPDEVFACIREYAGIGSGDKAVEIGVGTGQATKPFLDMGLNVTAAELGDRLAAYVGEKFADNENFSVICADFMDIRFEENAFDLIYSATAFHWLEQEAAYAKVLQLLKPGGTIALFWNHPFPNRLDDESNIANRRIYDKHRPGGKKVREFEEKDCAERVEAMKSAGFTDVRSKVFRRVRRLTTDEYIALINTYSDHRALPDKKRRAFEEDMKNAINEVGGKINIYDTVDLYLGRKAMQI